MNMLPCVDGDASVVGVSMVIDSALLLIQIQDGATCTYSICMRIRKHLSYQTKTKTSEERKSTCTKHTMFEKVHQILFFSKPLRPGAKVTLQRIPKAIVKPIKANAALVTCLLELTEAAAGVLDSASGVLDSTSGVADSVVERLDRSRSKGDS